MEYTDDKKWVTNPPIVLPKGVDNDTATYSNSRNIMRYVIEGSGYRENTPYFDIGYGDYYQYTDDSDIGPVYETYVPNDYLRYLTLYAMSININGFMAWSDYSRYTEYPFLGRNIYLWFDDESECYILSKGMRKSTAKIPELEQNVGDGFYYCPIEDIILSQDRFTMNPSGTWMTWQDEPTSPIEVAKSTTINTPIPKKNLRRVVEVPDDPDYGYMFEAHRRQY